MTYCSALAFLIIDNSFEIMIILVDCILCITLLRYNQNT